jgi:3-phosphoinositide dependent protein kinase-1
MGATALSVQEWVDTLDRAKEMALAQQSNGSYSDEAFRDLSSGLSSHANTLDRSSELQSESGPSSRATLVKHQPNDSDSVKGRKRFSRRHSKNGLAAVF